MVYISEITKRSGAAARRSILAAALVAALGSMFLSNVLGVREAFLQGYQAAQVVGMSVSVPENEWNTLAQGLDARADELNARESAIAAREESSQRTDNNALGTYLLAGIAFVLLILVLINFYSDWRRSEYSRP